MALRPIGSRQIRHCCPPPGAKRIRTSSSAAGSQPSSHIRCTRCAMSSASTDLVVRRLLAPFVIVPPFPFRLPRQTTKARDGLTLERGQFPSPCPACFGRNRASAFRGQRLGTRAAAAAGQPAHRIFKARERRRRVRRRVWRPGYLVLHAARIARLLTSSYRSQVVLHNCNYVTNLPARKQLNSGSCAL